MNKLRLFVAALLLSIPWLGRADDSRLPVVAEAMGAYATGLLWDCYLSYAQTELDVVKNKSSIPDMYIPLHMGNLSIVDSYLEKLRASFADDQSMIAMLDKIKAVSAAVHAQGDALQAYITGPKSNLNDVQTKHAAAKALLISLLGIDETTAAKMP